MFTITAKVKLAAGIAAGALTLGAAGAYAATANNTINATSPTPVTLGLGTNDSPLQVVTFNGGKLTPAPVGGFKDAGQCVSWLATNKNVALATSLSTSNTLPKSYHGTLMSKANAWCKTQLSATTKTTDTAETETPDATQSAAPETDSTGSQSNGHGHGHSHGRPANETD